MDTLIPNDYVHITGGKDLNITTGIPCKITHDGHYLDNGGGNHGSYVNLNWQTYDRNDNYSRQIWFFEETSYPGKYKISSDGYYLDTFGGENNSECRISKKNHHDNPYYLRQLWSFLNQNILESEKVQIQNTSNKCYLDTWGQYSTVRFSSYFNKPDEDFYSRQVPFVIFASKNSGNTCNIEINLSEKMQNITSWSFNRSKEIAFLDKLDVDINAEYAGVRGNLPEITEWDNKNTSLEATKKVQLDETKVSGKYLSKMQNKEEVKVKIIWHKVNLDIKFTATAKIKGFSDRLRKDGSIATMEQVDINAVLCFLRDSGFEGTYFGVEGKSVLVEVTGSVNIQGTTQAIYLNMSLIGTPNPWYLLTDIPTSVSAANAVFNGNNTAFLINYSTVYAYNKSNNQLYPTDANGIVPQTQDGTIIIYGIKNSPIPTTAKLNTNTSPYTWTSNEISSDAPQYLTGHVAATNRTHTLGNIQLNLYRTL
ncbi:6314_t:CDS:2 [Cetraspora pellucida]|uniref:6314_t:CDS:1 n=1 Tax=Cetraspora pellucida TaxID=1433469 RepID=A0A9N9B9C8_9GLOM|nr:6314_t:CDS:2 [Cetraspora pellucida]